MDGLEKAVEEFLQDTRCNGMCLRASDVLEDLSNVVGNPVARAHRMCPVHGDPEEVVQEALTLLGLAEAEIQQWKAAYGQDALATTTRRFREMEGKLSDIRKLLPSTLEEECLAKLISSQDIRAILDREDE